MKTIEIKVLIGCEESQEVCKAFRELGVEAYSNDIQDCSGGFPEYHLKMDIFEAIDKIKPTLLIAHPPCTYLTVTANRVFLNNPDRWVKRLDAINFVYKILNLDIKYIALENPVGVISTYIRKPDQYIQPYEFGHPDTKKTGLWLKDLPKLTPTNIVEPEYIVSKSGKKHSKTHWYSAGNSKLRSKTYSGIAKAMAEQWTKYLLNN